MSMIGLAIRNILARPLTTLLTLILFATGLAIMNLLITVGDQLDKKYTQNRAGIDMVVGAKGGRLQLILSSIYHIDNPVGNISIKEATFLFRDPRVDVIPLALGDNYESYRIVGTDHSYVDLYGGTIEEGTLWEKDFEVTIGAIVAENLGLKIGDQFAGVHGMAHEGHVHDEFQYEIVGILQPSGTVLDQLILTNISSVWAVHGNHGHDYAGHDHAGHDHAGHDHAEHDHAEHDHAEHDHAEQDKLLEEQAKRPKRQLKTHYLLEHPNEEVTALLVKFKGSSAILLQRYIDDETDMMSALPELESQRLFSIIEPGVYYVEMLAILIVVISGFSVFISLLRSLNERRYEIALMRVNGATRNQIFLMVVSEGIMLAILGFVAAFVLSHSIMFGISSYLTEAYHYQFDALYFTPQELNGLYIALGIGFASAMLPAIRAVRVNITRTLMER